MFPKLNGKIFISIFQLLQYSFILLLQTLRWWMEEEGGTRYTHAEASTTLPCHTM